MALAVVGRFEALLPKASELNLLTISVACGAILPILLFGFVLYPPRKSAEKFADQSDTAPEHVLYVDPTKLGNVKILTAPIRLGQGKKYLTKSSYKGALSPSGSRMPEPSSSVNGRLDR